MRVESGILLSAVIAIIVASGPGTLTAEDQPNWQATAQVRPGKSHMVPSFWANSPPLNPKTTVKILDVDGPGVVSLIHLSALNDGSGFASAAAQSVMVRVYYDGASKPAIEMPLMDFVGDIQCQSTYFNTVYFSKVRESHNFRLPMPFRKHVTIAVENPSDKKLDGYVDVQWESVPSIPADSGYLHTDYRTGDIDPHGPNTLCEISGAGTIVAHWLQFTSPRSPHGEVICEANQEIRLDGDTQPTLNYLGTEDVYGYSWGFKKTDSDNHGAIIRLDDLTRGSLVAMLRCREVDAITFARSCSWIITYVTDPGAQQILLGSVVPFRHCVYYYAKSAASAAR